MVVVAAFFGGRHFEREQRHREQRAASDAASARAAAKGETLEALGSIVGSNATPGFDPQNTTLTTAPD
jgi:hypothetical protein